MGLENFPFSKFSSNSVWLMVVMLAQDLLAWAQRLCLEGHWPQPSPSGCATPSRTFPGGWCAPPGG